MSNRCKSGTVCPPKEVFHSIAENQKHFPNDEGMDSGNGHFLLDMEIEGAEMEMAGAGVRLAHAPLASGVQTDQPNNCFTLRLPCLH